MIVMTRVSLVNEYKLKDLAYFGKRIEQMGKNYTNVPAKLHTKKKSKKNQNKILLISKLILGLSFFVIS